MQNLQRILVPTDFSEGAAYALIYAINLAEQICQDLHILHVDEEGSKSEDEITKQFDRLKHHYLFRRNINATFKSVKGNIADCIKSEVEASKIDLVILGMVGTHGAKEMMFGSITAKLIDRPPCAILAIPEQCVVLTAKHIAVASDNELQPRLSEMYVVNYISEAFDSRVDIFHVLQEEKVPTINEDDVKEHYNELFKYNLHDFFEVEDENLIEAIKSYVDDHKIDLLAVLHKNHDNRPHERSVSKQLAFSTKLPLLIVPIN